MIIRKNCTFSCAIASQSPSLTVTVGNGFDHAAWAVAINEDSALSATRPEGITLKRENAGDSLCDSRLMILFEAARTNSSAHGAVATIKIGDDEMQCEHLFTAEEKAADIVVVKFRIRIKLTC